MSDLAYLLEHPTLQAQIAGLLAPIKQGTGCEEPSKQPK